MHSLKTEISEFDNRSFTSEEKTKGYLTAADQYDLDIRDIGKRINSLEQEYDGTSNSLLSSESKLCDLEKELGKHEEEISALNRRQQLLEGDNKQSDEKVDIGFRSLFPFFKIVSQLAATTLSLAQTSKNADNILKQVKLAENRNMNNEVTIEELDKNLKEANKMKRDAEYKLEELSRRLGVMEVNLETKILHAIL